MNPIYKTVIQTYNTKTHTYSDSDNDTNTHDSYINTYTLGQCIMREILPSTDITGTCRDAFTGVLYRYMLDWAIPAHLHGVHRVIADLETVHDVAVEFDLYVEIIDNPWSTGFGIVAPTPELAKGLGRITMALPTDLAPVELMETSNGQNHKALWESDTTLSGVEDQHIYYSGLHRLANRLRKAQEVARGPGELHPHTSEYTGNGETKLLRYPC